MLIDTKRVTGDELTWCSRRRGGAERMPSTTSSASPAGAPATATGKRHRDIHVKVSFDIGLRGGTHYKETLTSHAPRRPGNGGCGGSVVSASTYHAHLRRATKGVDITNAATLHAKTETGSGPPARVLLRGLVERVLRGNPGNHGAFNAGSIARHPFKRRSVPQHIRIGGNLPA